MQNRGMMLAACTTLAGAVWAQGEATEVPATESAAAERFAEELGAMAQQGMETFEWGLLLEAEGAYEKTGDEEASDLVLATVEFTMDAAVNDWLSGHVGLLWEEDDTEENNLDEAFITVGSDLYARAGRYYLPFGNFESAFISDPLTLELAEINHSSAMVGYGNELFDVSAGAFKGDNEDVIENLYAAANAAIGETARVGIYWISDITETATQTELVEEAELAGDLVEKQGGAGAYANLFLGPVMLNTEYVAALEDVSTTAGFSGTPMAYNLEASVNFLENWTAGIKHEGSDDLFAWDGDALAPGAYHETGYGAVVSFAFHDNAVIGLEYMHLQPENDADDDTDLVTVQLAFEI